ncbi:hypothetical protein HOD24_04065 [Candidatus Peregrinibacteria bacterium]|nr:hypothetical protein [Candidatus Peregrinibacteria bacterium]MBT4367537.1 hypothetical protein [Candidatus Peregrinibacteria bacterium]MBT6730745.1 hypothetical protein [Candidatus Peregrinibacteria bacterium]MBT7009429.1 hypothetical protein [Candidatus Peregrinibacteria bacterium]MBT7344753.1 hypothetical protein [Candidatus Peregrinibacteria bacterium]
MIKYRERVGDMFGEADWMQKVGGIYGIIFISAIAIFFFSIAKMTGTTDIFLSPLINLLPGGHSVENMPSF